MGTWDRWEVVQGRRDLDELQGQVGSEAGGVEHGARGLRGVVLLEEGRRLQAHEPAALHNGQHGERGRAAQGWWWGTRGRETVSDDKA